MGLRVEGPLMAIAIEEWDGYTNKAGREVPPGGRVTVVVGSEFDQLPLQIDSRDVGLGKKLLRDHTQGQVVLVEVSQGRFGLELVSVLPVAKPAPRSVAS